MDPAQLSVSSSAFDNNGFIPSEYTCEGLNISPPLSINYIPHDAKSLVLIMDDPDAPKGTFDHWLMWNIKPSREIPENGAKGAHGKNGFGKNNYMGPCPPSGVHHYHFKVYALDIMLDINEGADKKTIENAIKNHVLAQGELMGMYKKAR